MSSLRCCKRSPNVLRSVNTRVPVQLLQDVEDVGVRGQIVRVKPGFMRNFLHVDNKACYITENSPPRIPIVDINELREQRRLRQKELAKQRKKEEQLQDATKSVVNEEVVDDAEGVLSQDELSQFFSGLTKTSKTSAEIFSSDIEITDNEAELFTLKSDNMGEKIPKVVNMYTSKYTLPLDGTVVAKHLTEIGGEEVSPLSVKLSYEDTPEEVLSAITQAGRYLVTLETGKDGRKISRVLEVE